ncbi:MAG: MotA/TolQ/ExbB proton channel family protein [Lentisphaerae bacterium ADurb.Bin242]|nr:MAG: MotA/TolQ/ExbB proton channel family protein [Lentisphaerae bacterium ADurb.Bin242]
MTLITQTLNWISNGLLLPVIVLLLAGLAASLITLGGFASYVLSAFRERARARELMKQFRKGDFSGSGEPGLLAMHVRQMEQTGWNRLDCEKFISDLRAEYDRELEHLSFMIKAAPMLGLMGTLIPMGPALAGLSSGDIATMAYNIQIAFATTVVGCFIAGVNLLVYSVKRHGFADEVSNLIYLLECRNGEAPDAKVH